MMNNYIDKAMGISGLIFDRKTVQPSALGKQLTAGNAVSQRTDKTSDLQGCHLRWSCSPYAGYPRFGADLYKGGANTSNIAFDVNYQHDLSERKKQADYNNHIRYESYHVLWPIGTEEDSPGAATVVVEQFDIGLMGNVRAIQLHLMGFTGEPDDGEDWHEDHFDIYATFNNPQQPSGTQTVKVAEITLQHLELKPIYFELPDNVVEVSIKGRLAFLTHIEGFVLPWSDVIAQHHLVRFTDEPFRLRSDPLALLNRATIASSAKPAIFPPEELEVFEMLEDMLCNTEHEEPPYYREYEVDEDRHKYASDVEEDDPEDRLKPHNMYSLLSVDPEMARLLGAYCIDADYQQVNGGEGLYYLLTIFHDDPQKVATAFNPLGLSGVAVTTSIEQEHKRPVADFDSFTGQSIATLKDSKMSDAFGVRLNWSLKPFSGSSELPVIYQFDRNQKGQSTDFFKQFVAATAVNDTSPLNYYDDLLYPKGEEFKANYEYGIVGIDLWGRRNSAQQVKDVQLHFLPTPAVPAIVSATMQQDTTDQLSVSFLWGMDQYQSDYKITEAQLWLNGYETNGRFVSALKAVENNGIVTVTLDQSAKLGDLSSVNDSWPLNLLGHRFLLQGTKIAKAYSKEDIEQQQLRFYAISDAVKGEISFANADFPQTLIDQINLNHRTNKLKTEKVKAHIAPDWSNVSAWEDVAKEKRLLKQSLKLSSFKNGLEPETHKITLQIDAERQLIFISFKHSTPFKDKTHRSYKVSPGSIAFEDKEYVLQPYDEQDPKASITGDYVIEEVFDDVHYSIPEDQVEVAVYPLIHYTFKNVEHKILDKTERNLKPYAFALRVKDQYGTWSAMCKRQQGYWVDQSRPNVQQHVKPRTLGKEAPKPAQGPDYFGQSSHPVTFGASDNTQYYIYRTTDDALIDLANEVLNKNLTMEYFREGLSYKEQMSLLQELANDKRLNEAFARISDQTLQKPTGTKQFIYEDNSLDGRSTSYYLYKASVLADNGNESELSPLIDIVRCDPPPVLEQVGIQTVRTHTETTGLAITWNHVPNPDLDYYLLLRNDWAKSQQTPSYKHWRASDKMIKINASDNALPLRIQFGVLDLAFLPSDETNPVIDGVYLRSDVEAVVGKLYPTMSFKHFKQKDSINLLKQLDLNVYAAFIEGFAEQYEGKPVVVFYHTDQDKSPDPYYEKETVKAYIDASATDKTVNYGYRLLAVANGEKVISDIAEEVFITDQ